MSKCERCEAEMHPADAAQSFLCFKCRKLTQQDIPVRRMGKKEEEAIGRRARSSRTIGGSADMDPNDEADEEGV